MYKLLLIDYKEFLQVCCQEILWKFCCCFAKVARKIKLSTGFCHDNYTVIVINYLVHTGFYNTVNF